MKIAEYQQMMDYLTGPRERFSNGGSVEGEKLISSLKKKKDSLGRPNISEYQEKLKQYNGKHVLQALLLLVFSQDPPAKDLLLANVIFPDYF